MTYFAGIDIGSTLTKVAILGDTGVVGKAVGATGPEHRKLANRVMEEALRGAGLAFGELGYVVATGYGRINVPFADKQITEISCHARGVSSMLPTVRTIIDIGGQDCKGIKIAGGRVVDFVMNDKCAAGTGRFLEVIADGLGIKLEEMGELSLLSTAEVAISSTCTVFAEQEVVARRAEGVPMADLVAGVHMAIASRVYGMVNRLKIETDVAVTGGGALNIGLVRALEKRLGLSLLRPPEPLFTGAVGAALLGQEAVQEAAAAGRPLQRKSGVLREATFFT